MSHKRPSLIIWEGWQSKTLHIDIVLEFIPWQKFNSFEISSPRHVERSHQFNEPEMQENQIQTDLDGVPRSYIDPFLSRNLIADGSNQK